MNDNEIINLYFQRDENAITETKKKYDTKMKGLSFKILKNNEDMEECVSDTYLKAWITIPPQKPIYFYAYLAKICRFLCFGKLDYNNAQKRNAEIITLSDELLECIPSNLSESQIDEQILKNILECFLESLSQEKRLIFMRRYWFSDSISEISKRYHISESKVKTSLYRTRSELKIYLQKEGITI